MLDIEFIDEPQATPDEYKSEGQLKWFYDDLVEVFKWGNDANAQKKIKQCLSNKLTSAYQSGQMNTQHRVNSEIQTLRQRIKELEERYEPRQKDQDKGYNKGKYTGD